MIEDEYEDQKIVHHVVDESRSSTRTISGSHMTEESTGSVNPWSGRLQDKKQDEKGKKKVFEESSGDESFDEEHGLPHLRTPGSKYAEKYVPPYARVEEKSVPQLRRSERVRYPVDRLTYNGYMRTHYAYMVSHVQHKEPTCFQEAIGKPEWESAMDDEMDALVKNETWDLVRLPSGKKAIGSKWVYKIKCKSDGSVERYKARLVAKGYAQTKGLDYDETFSPVAKMTTVRLVIAMASMPGWKLRQMDVNNAFLNGDLEEEVYMIQPKGYEHPEFPYYVWRLKKALYGLKQAPRAWCEKITRFLKKIGFKQSTVDHSLF
ncbi:hypothetical protein L7F22_040030 [Adiantum nelumboides]|nr:hypothetical protein [Adiantum nelumboides]